MQWAESTPLVDFKAKKFTKFIAKYYPIVCHNFKANKVTKFMAKYYAIVCNNFKAKQDRRYSDPKARNGSKIKNLSKN